MRKAFHTVQLLPENRIPFLLADEKDIVLPTDNRPSSAA